MNKAGGGSGCGDLFIYLKSILYKWTETTHFCFNTENSARWRISSWMTSAWLVCTIMVQKSWSWWIIHPDTTARKSVQLKSSGSHQKWENLRANYKMSCSKAVYCSGHLCCSGFGKSERGAWGGQSKAGTLWESNCWTKNTRKALWGGEIFPNYIRTNYTTVDCSIYLNHWNQQVTKCFT